MNFVIPMAGRGRRFVDAGFETPKMLIEVNGKTLLDWSLDSLPMDLCTRLIFILLKEHADSFELDKIIHQKYSKFNPQFVYLKDVTRGQAETVLMSKNLWNLDEELLIYNIDTAFHSPSLHQTLRNHKSDGVLGAFMDESDANKYSYAKLADDGAVVEVVEKVKISNYALTGLYHFTHPADFICMATKNIQDDNTVKGEFYVAPIYNQLIQVGRNFTIDVCESIDVLGTPEELEMFKNNQL